MTDQNNQEPTMEEILASIRRIISEDDPPAAAEEAAPAAAAAPTPVAAPEPVVAAAPEPDPEPARQPESPAAPQLAVEPEEEDVLELTERVEEAPAPAPPVESMGDLDVFPVAPPAPVAAPEPAPPVPEPVAAAPLRPSFFEPSDDSLVGSPAASASASAFAALTQTISMPRDGRTLEDVTRELLRPLIKQWLDENLPRIVETAVQTEVERIARRHT